MPSEHNRQLQSTLENINTTLYSLKEQLSQNNVKQERQHFQTSPSQSQNFKPLSSDAKQQSKIIAESFQNAFQQAEKSLSTFSSQSKNQFSDLSSFIQRTLSDITIGNLVSNPLSLLSQGFSSLFSLKAHSGGLISDLAPSLQSDEIPVIARKGEAIFTPQQMQSADNILSHALNNQGNLSVTINNHTPAHVETSKNVSDNGQINLDIVINEAESLIARRLSLGGGLAPTIEGRYGISPRGRG
jgi:hypothetical protein